MPSRCGAEAIPVVLDPRLAGVVAHETVGHLCEADTQLEDPVAAALAAPGRQLGSELLTIGDDGSVVGLRGTLPFDDEGTPPSNTLLVQHGVVVGRLHSRETAARFGERPTGQCQGHLLPSCAARAAHQHLRRERQRHVSPTSSAT